MSELLAARAKAGGWWHWVPDSLVQWDQSVFDAATAKDRGSALYWFADQMVHRWSGMLLLFLVFGILLRLSFARHRSRRTLCFEFLFFLIVVGIGNVLSDEIKLLFGRLKPHVSRDIPGAKQALSFPSNHSFNTATILGFWGFYLRGIRPSIWANVIGLLTLVWVFTAWARVYLGEHFPLDVLGGFLLGLVYGIYGAWLLILVRRRLGKRHQ